MRLLVTGGCGFVGSNFIRYVLQHYGPEMVTNVDALTTGRLANLDGAAETYGDRYEFLPAHVADGDRIEAVLAKHQYYAVVHFAAEFADPAATISLLDRAQRHGVRRFLIVSKMDCGAPLAAAEGAALARCRARREEVVIVRATDNYGPFQSPAGLIPSVTINALLDRPVRLPGDGTQFRDWLHVEDHCAALFTALLDGRPGKIYDLAPGNRVRDIDLAHRILDLLGRSRDSIVCLGDPTAEPCARHSETTTEPLTLAWKPRHHFEQGLRETVQW